LVRNSQTVQPKQAREVLRSLSRLPPFVLLFLAGAIFVFASSVIAQESAGSSSAADSLARARALLRQSKPNDALVLLNQAATTDSATPGLETQFGEAYFQSKRFPEAISHLKIALQQNPRDLEATQLLGLCYYGSGEYAQAAPLLEKLGPELSRSDADGPYLLGICYIMTKRWDDARKTFAGLFSVSPESSMAHLMFGKILIRQRMEEAAIPEIEKALQLDPRLPMAHFLLGEIDLFKKDPPAAVVEFQKELAINPSVWLVYWRLGDSYVQMGNFDEAEKVLKEAVWLNEWSSGAYILLGQIAVKKGNSDLAVGFLEKAEKLDPQNFWVHYFLARAYHNLGRPEEASKEFDISKSLQNDQLTDERKMFQTGP
jgi:tetratricopeptide (TPR) repeat protein